MLPPRPLPREGPLWGVSCPELCAQRVRGPESHARAPGCRVPLGQACAWGQTALLGLVLWESNLVFSKHRCARAGQGPHTHATLTTAQEGGRGTGRLSHLPEVAETARGGPAPHSPARPIPAPTSLPVDRTKSAVRTGHGAQGSCPGLLPRAGEAQPQKDPEGGLGLTGLALPRHHVWPGAARQAGVACPGLSVLICEMATAICPKRTRAAWGQGVLESLPQSPAQGQGLRLPSSHPDLLPA